MSTRILYLTVALLLAAGGARAQTPVTVIGPVTPGNCVAFSSNTVIKDSGGVCGGGGGSITPPLVLNPNATTTPPAQAIVITQSSPTTGSSGGPYSGSLTSFTFQQAISGTGSLDPYNLQTGYITAHRSNCDYTGSNLNITGSPTSLAIGGYTCAIFTQRLLAPVNASAAGDKMTVVINNYSNTVDTSGYGNYALVSNVQCDQSCQTTDHVGYDLDIGLTGTTTRRHGIRMTVASNFLTGTATQGSTLDSAMTFANLAAQAGGWQHLFSLSSSGFTTYACNPNACSPIALTGDWFASEPAAGATAFKMARFVNLPNVKFTTSYLEFNNFLLQSDTTNDAGSQLVLMRMTQNALGGNSSNPSAAIWLRNTTAAANNAQQVSPGITLTGQGFRVSGSASVAIDWTIYALPVQGTANPSSALCLAWQINAGGYTCASAASSNGAFASLNGFTSTLFSVPPYVVQPQGRLTLQSGVPVMTTNQTAKSQVFYDCFGGGNIVHVYNGSVDVPLIIGSCEISMTLQASSTGAVGAGDVFDVWAVNIAGTLTLCVATNGSGLGWAGDVGGSITARGTGYSQVDTTTRPYVTNKNSITNCYTGATQRGPITANQGTYLGSLFTSANGQTTWNKEPTTAAHGAEAQLYLWNAYNRVTTRAVSRNSTATETVAASATPAVIGSNAFRISFVSGLSIDAINISLGGAIQNGAASNAAAYAGFAFDATNSLDRFFGAFTGNGLSTQNINYAGTFGTFDAQVGKHFFQAVASGDGTTAGNYFPNGGGGSLGSQGLEITVRM